MGDVVAAAYSSADAHILRPMETITKGCANCDLPLSLKVPEEGTLGRRMAESLGILCAKCADDLEAAEATAKHRRDRDQLRDLSGLPSELRGLTFDDYELTAERAGALKAARAWVAGETKGLALVGEVGTGKTRLAAIAAWARIEALRPVRWISVPRLVVMANAGFGTEEKREAQQMLTGKVPLVLDDLDKVKASESVQSLLFLAIDNRVSAGAPLLVTTNLGPTEIKAKLGDPILSRLKGYCTWAEVKGPDRRL